MSTIQVNLMADSQGGSVAPISSVMRNRLIDAGFTINQRGYVSGTALSAGTYAHDRFKAGASGCTYTFTQLSTGVPIVITITAGSLQQVIEGANMGDGGTYVLSWTGTAQAKFNGGSFGASPLAVTGIVAGANTTIEFGTGTCSFPQLEKGTQATGFEYRQIGQELALCQRYYYKLANMSIGSPFATGFVQSSTQGNSYFIFPVSMRVAPSSLDTTGTAGDYQYRFQVTSVTCSAIPSIAETSPNTAFVFFTVSSGLTAGNGGVSRAATTNAYLGFGAEL